MKKLILLGALVVATLHAEPVTLTRNQAFELHDALSALAPGLAPANTISAADNIVALEPTAASLRRAAVALERQRLAANTPALTAAVTFAAAAFDAQAEEPKTYDLAIITLAPSEIEAAKITPRHLAVIKRLLKPDPKPEKK